MAEIGKQKLSRDELAALLKTREAPGAEPVTKKGGTSRRVSKYDFTQPSRFNKSELESLRKTNEALAQAVGSAMTRLIKTGIKARLVNIGQMKWKDMAVEAGELGPGFAFRMNPQEYNCAFTIGRRLAGSCLDRLTGGLSGPIDENGEKESVPEDLTPLEQRLLVRVAECFTQQLPTIWSAAGRFEIELGMFVNDFSEYDLLPPEEDVFQVVFLVQGTLGSGQVNLIVPFHAVQSLPSRHEQARNVARGEDDIAASLRDNLNQTTVEVAAVLGAIDIKVGALLNMQPGDVLLLDRRVDERVDVLFNRKPKLNGYIGLSSGRYAVRIDRDNSVPKEA